MYIKMEKKKTNQSFKKAFYYLKKQKLIKNQKDLASKIGIGETPVSHLMKGTSSPSYDTLLKMNEIFDGIFNLDFFSGDSEVMLVKDLEDGQHRTAQTASADDESMKMVLEAKNETIESLKRELAAKDDMINNMKQQVADLRAMLNLNFKGEKMPVQSAAIPK